MSLVEVGLFTYLSFLFKSEHKLLSTKDPLANLFWMADRSAIFLEQGGSRNSLRDAWAQCIAGLLEPHLLPAQCPTAVTIAWPYVVDRMKKAYFKLDPGWVRCYIRSGCGHRWGEGLWISLWRYYFIVLNIYMPDNGVITKCSVSNEQTITIVLPSPLHVLSLPVYILSPSQFHNQ